MAIIKIKNCNCIKEASISVEPRALNIKYGINGTGKSTISNAISIAATGGDISCRRPYGICESDEEQPEIQALEYETIVLSALAETVGYEKIRDEKKERCIQMDVNTCNHSKARKSTTVSRFMEVSLCHESDME